MTSTATDKTPTTTERWTLDRRKTTVEFEVKHFWGLQTVHGHFDRFEGSYAVASRGAELELAIDVASIDTGNAARDEHLRSADFFDVTEHPQVRFTSTHVLGTGSGGVRVTGELLAAGTSVPIAFDASVRVIDGELEIEATTTVDQSHFGMSRGPLWNVRPSTTLHVNARLVTVRRESSLDRNGRARPERTITEQQVFGRGALETVGGR